MKTVVTITTPPLEWSKQKLVEMRRDILLFLAQQCAPNSQWTETLVGMPPEKPKAAPMYVKLKCKSCKLAPWYADKFTSCPVCGQRQTVVKATVKRVPLPDGVQAVE
jgi:hypothetical protein